MDRTGATMAAIASTVGVYRRAVPRIFAASGTATARPATAPDATRKKAAELLHVPLAG